MNRYSGHPGWYPDPLSASGGQRYWDGQQWTVYAPYAPPRPEPPRSELPRSEWWRSQSTPSRVVLSILAAVYVVVAAVGIAQCASNQSLRARCEALAEAIGYEGAEKEWAVTLCISNARADLNIN